MSPLLPVTNTNSLGVVVCMRPVLSKSNAEAHSDSPIQTLQPYHCHERASWPLRATVLYPGTFSREDEA
jgi:hypothetical protein